MSESTDFFRGRGTTFLAERNNLGIIGPAIEICQDQFSYALATDNGEHMNRCGLVDAPDARYLKSVSGTITLSHAHVSDENFAVSNLGTVTPAGSAQTVTDELLPDNLVAGSVYFLGGLEPHGGITGLVISGAVLGTDYTLDPVSGMVRFLTDQPTGTTASYGYTDGASVSIQTAAQKQYFLTFVGWNLMNNNAPGKMMLYNTRFDPTKLVEFINEDLQIMELEGSMLVDPSKPILDTVFGRFGQRSGF